MNTDNQGLSIEISDPLGLRHAEKGDQVNLIFCFLQKKFFPIKLLHHLNLFHKVFKFHLYQCTEGLKLCCNPLPRGIIENEIVTQYGQEDKYILPFSTLCDSSPAVAAIQNFSKGIACGKRDSRYDYPRVSDGFS